MSKELVVILRDDMTGELGDDVITRTFAIGSDSYELELSEASWAEFCEYLSGYVDAARKIRKHRKKPATKKPEPIPDPVPIAELVDRSKPARSKEESRAIREWARENGHEVSVRGTIKAEVIQAYQDAEGDSLVS